MEYTPGLDSPEQYQHLSLRYFSGELSANELDELEERLISDADFSQSMRHARDELLDAYLSGELPPDDHERVQQALRSSGQNYAIDFARALRDHARSGQQPDIPAPLKRRSRFMPRAILIASCAASLCLAVFWNARRGSLPSSAPVTLRSSALKTSQQQNSRHELAFVVLLSANVTRGPGSTMSIVIPRDSSTVQVQIVLNGSDITGSFRVTVQGTDGETPPTFSGLRPERLNDEEFLSFRMPASELKPGTYTFSVFSEKDLHSPIASYRMKSKS